MSGQWWWRGTVLGLGLLGVVWALDGRGQVKPAEPSPLEPSRVRVEEWLDREVTVPFARETSIGEVAAHLSKALQIRVVLDPAAFNRLGLGPEDPVRLELDGQVRLRTALPLLLDQLDLTYRFVPEDRLLLITDGIGAHDGFRQLLEEVREMHRDLYDLQDLLYEVLDGMAEDDPAK